MTIRDLKADEIEARVQSVTEKGAILLLYKNARCDMNILDETFGSLNWKREHCFLDGKCYCTVSVWDEKKNQWVSKQDVGIESNQDAEKGQASDDFKRACFNWGIGRELYTSPFIFIPAGKANITKNQNGKFVCYDYFDVKSIEIKDKVITGLAIVNSKTKEEVYRYGATKKEPAKKEKETEEAGYPVFEDSWTPPKTRTDELKQLCEKAGKKYEDMVKWMDSKYHISNPDGLPQASYLEVVAILEKAVKK